jgi:hypothetical protein
MFFMIFFVLMVAVSTVQAGVCIDANGKKIITNTPCPEELGTVPGEPKPKPQLKPIEPKPEPQLKPIPYQALGFDMKHGLSKEQRSRIFCALDAQQQVVRDDPNCPWQVDRCRNAMENTYHIVAKRYGIAVDVLNHIAIEGASAGISWFRQCR